MNQGRYLGNFIQIKHVCIRLDSFDIVCKATSLHEVTYELLRKTPFRVTMIYLFCKCLMYNTEVSFTDRHRHTIS